MNFSTAGGNGSIGSMYEDVRSPRWETIYHVFLDLYKRLPTHKIVEVLQAKHDFKTTVNICESKIRQWKNAGRLPPRSFKRSEKRAIIETTLKRKAADGRKSEYRYHGFPIPQDDVARIQREFKQEQIHNHAVVSASSVEAVGPIQVCNPKLPTPTLNDATTTNTPFKHYTALLFYEQKNAPWQKLGAGPASFAMEQEQGNSSFITNGSLAVKERFPIPIVEMTMRVSLLNHDLCIDFSSFEGSFNPTSTVHQQDCWFENDGTKQKATLLPEARTFTLAYLVQKFLEKYKQNENLVTPLGNLLSRLSPSAKACIKNVLFTDKGASGARLIYIEHQIENLHDMMEAATRILLHKVVPPHNMTSLPYNEHENIKKYPKEVAEYYQFIGLPDPARYLLRNMKQFFARTGVSTQTVQNGNLVDYNKQVDQLGPKLHAIKEDIWEMLVCILDPSRYDVVSAPTQAKYIQKLVECLERTYRRDVEQGKSLTIIRAVWRVLESHLRENDRAHLEVEGSVHQTAVLPARVRSPEGVIRCCNCGYGDYLWPFNVVCIKPLCGHAFCPYCEITEL